MYIKQRNDWIQSQSLSYDTLKEQVEDIRKKEDIETRRAHFNKHSKVLDNFATQHAQFFLENKAHYTIGTDGAIDISMDQGIKLPNNCAKSLEDILHLCIPWRKGPFIFFTDDMTGENFCKTNGYVDAEWRSEKKWNRLCDLYDIQTLCQNKFILDLGCNNFYYSLRILERQANMVLGIDPTPRYLWYYKLFSILFPSLPLFYEMCGAPFSHTVSLSMSAYFDTVFCMGILYHQRNPLECLKSLYSCLKRGGYLVVDTMCISSKDDICLFPQKTYQNSRGYWFIPSASVVRHWLTRSGFNIVAYDQAIKINAEEQRRTKWMTTHSLSNFLYDDCSKTVEAYEAPHRCIVIAQKK